MKLIFHKDILKLTDLYWVGPKFNRKHTRTTTEDHSSLLTLCTINCILRRWHGTQKFTYVSDSLTVDKFLFCKQSGTVLVGRVNNFLNFLTCDIDTMRGVDAVNFFNTQTSVTVLQFKLYFSQKIWVRLDKHFIWIMYWEVSWWALRLTSHDSDTLCFVKNSCQLDVIKKSYWNNLIWITRLNIQQLSTQIKIFNVTQHCKPYRLKRIQEYIINT